MLLVAVIGAAVAGVFGAGVAKHLSPYGANDPATQSVQASNRFQAGAGRQIDPGVIALVSAGDVRSARTRHRVSQVAAQLRAQPDVASVASFYDTHSPAMVSRDGRSTYVVAYFKPLSDSRLKNDAQQIQNAFAGQHDVKLGGQAMANAQANTQVSHDLAHAELLAFPFIFLLSLLFFRSLVAALLPPLFGGLAIIATFFVLRVGGQLRRSVGVRTQPGHRPGARPGDRLQPVHGLSLSRGGGRLRLRSGGTSAHARDVGTNDPVQLD